MDRRKGTTKGGTTKRRTVICVDLEHPCASNPRPYQVLVCRMITLTSNAWWLADPRSPRHHLTFAISNVRCLLSACEGDSSDGSTSSSSKIDHCLAGEIVEEATHANRLYHQKRLMRHRRRQPGKCEQWIPVSIVVAAVPAVSVCCRHEKGIAVVDTVASATITVRATAPEVARQSPGEQCN